MLKYVLSVVAAVCFLSANAFAIMGGAASKALSYSNVVRGKSTSGTTYKETKTTGKSTDVGLSGKNQSNTPQTHLVNLSNKSSATVSANVGDTFKVILPTGTWTFGTSTGAGNNSLPSGIKSSVISSMGTNTNCYSSTKITTEEGSNATIATFKFVPGKFIVYADSACNVPFDGASAKNLKIVNKEEVSIDTFNNFAHIAASHPGINSVTQVGTRPTTTVGGLTSATGSSLKRLTE